MKQVDRETDRYLALLRDRVRQRGFTQREVQSALGWGRSYISQLLTKQKKLRVDHVLLMLNVIGVDPAEFFAEFYGLRGTPRGHSRQRETPRNAGKPESLRRQMRQLEILVQAVVKLLLERRVITSSDLRAAEQEAMASEGRQ